MDLQAGYYKAKAVVGSEQYGKTQKGFDQIALDLVLTEGEQKGFRLTTFLVFSNDSAQYSLERLKALGWKGGNDLAGIEANEVTVEVKHDTYNGKQQMKVDIVTGGGRVVLKEQMSEGEKRAFFTRLNQIAAAPTPNGTPAAGPTDFPHGANVPGQQPYKL